MERRERQRKERAIERERERKCIHSRLILIGHTHWLPARTQLHTMLIQQKYTHTHSLAVLIIYEWEV